MSCEGECVAKFRTLSDVDGPRGKWCIDKDRTTAGDNSFHFDFRRSFDIKSVAIRALGWSSCFPWRPLFCPITRPRMRIARWLLPIWIG